MHISFSPVRADHTLAVAYNNETITLNGALYDFQDIPEGEALSQDVLECEHIVTDVVRQDGVIHLTLVLPHGPDAATEVLFPTPVTVTGSGNLVLPGK
ncbi:hypothetical protein ROG8370_03313 [Roseovarius gaetbuli]|uniref:Uncharacterized protein n=1 Tax=Roseovarius gaetbuli TaxID=1356575 RepID=A0A1X7A4J7_9RHOB|nr:hypothetical protein [Roseovarius gaetbuli]SLN69926.1 hypothetical protein ROG8370_03313 [Roseovarius gaetbuli]